MKRIMRTNSHTGESKIGLANGYYGEFHVIIEKQIINR
ncbi:hypothetical protein EV194_109143 [Natronoflexus pectinivorans]|uniref:Uncharacterized protein n=1 Tax=Natronoflexus pectinivorans TaxID=682526 RepID=A0A4R2GGH1_9BACT|nr:hypothetical protein EV194_109143 [Natronoflexus pectinivorans]